MIQIFAMDSVNKHTEHVKPVTHVPMTSMKGLYLDIWDLSFREDAKYGEVGRWPATHAYKAHFGSFLEHGFQSHRECLDIKFSNTAVETTNPVFAIDRFSAQYVDGQNKAIIMLSILALAMEMDPHQ